VKECRGGHAPPLAIDNVDVDVDVDVVVDLVVDTSGHPLATGVSHFGLRSALGTYGASCLQSLGRAHVHVHVHDDVHDHVATCPPDTFTGSQESGQELRAESLHPPANRHWCQAPAVKVPAVQQPIARKVTVAHTALLPPATPAS
jgi:hypothetical protein